jgi:hypothetical protein
VGQVREPLLEACGKTRSGGAACAGPPIAPDENSSAPAEAFRTPGGYSGRQLLETMGAASLRSMPSEYAELNNLHICVSLVLWPFSRRLGVIDTPL